MSLIKLYAPAGLSGLVSGVYTGNVQVGNDGTVLVDPRDVAALMQAGFSLTSGVPGVANFRNFIDGGDFTINPWQRGTSFTGIANTLTYTADRWFAVGGASSSISVSQQAISAVSGIADALQFGRASTNTNTAALTLGQVLETLDSIRAQGQQLTVSFWAKPGANFSAASLGVQLVSGTGTNQSAANLVAGSWTNQANLINAAQALNGLQRYEFTGTVPAACAQLGLLFSYTPVGTAGAADYVQIAGVQVELGNAAGPFEHRDVQVELEICQRYFFEIGEPGSGVVVGAGMIAGTNAEIIFIPLPVQMRAAPTVTVSAGSFKFNVAGSATAVGAGFAAGSTHTPNYISVVGTATATSGQATLLQGGGGSGYVQASADL